MKLSWTFIFIVGAIVTWWILRKKGNVRVAAQESAPLTNLENNIKSALAVVNNTLKVATSAETHAASDTLVDSDPAYQNARLQSDFITNIKSENSKILMIDDDPLQSASLSTTMQRDQMWWPERMYQDTPEWLKPEFDLSKLEECSCGCGELLMKS